MAGITELSKSERDLASRGLRVKAPKPNIIRIEVLDGTARERYLGGLQRLADSTIKKTVYQRIVPVTDTVFYGFVKNQGEQPISLNTQWADTGGSGGLMGGAKALIDKAATGSGAFGSVAKVVSGGIKAAEGIEAMAKTITGIDATLTGSSSLKQVQSVGISGFTVNCGWYLPEQLNLGMSSLKILIRMAYPRQIADRVFQSFFDSVSDGAGDITNVVGEFAERAGAVIGADNATVQKGTDATRGLSEYVAGGEAYTDFNSIVGRNLTLDPLPVRVSMGHYLDIEPMVITNVNISFSKEQWVAPNGRHLPIFLNVDISFDMWMSPAPRLEFMQFLGNEMFGTDSYQSGIINNLEAKDKAREQRIQLEQDSRQQNKGSVKNVTQGIDDTFTRWGV